MFGILYLFYNFISIEPENIIFNILFTYFEIGSCHINLSKSLFLHSVKLFWYTTSCTISSAISSCLQDMMFLVWSWCIYIQLTFISFSISFYYCLPPLLDLYFEKYLSHYFQWLLLCSLFIVLSSHIREIVRHISLSIWFISLNNIVLKSSICPQMTQIYLFLKAEYYYIMHKYIFDEL